MESVAKKYFESLNDLMNKVDLAVLSRVVELLGGARKRGSMIFVLGNGGSAATASHFANDLGKSTKSRKPFSRVLSLTDNVAWLTALANDEGYERTFAGQLENYVREGDVVVAISASGNSKNVLQAVELAKSQGASTVGLTGFDGGILITLVDECLHVPTPCGSYPLVEDIHMIILNIIVTCLMQDESVIK